MSPIDPVVDPLFDLELKVARRADELSRRHGTQVKNALELWCEAEREVFGNPRIGREMDRTDRPLLVADGVVNRH